MHPYIHAYIHYTYRHTYMRIYTWTEARGVIHAYIHTCMHAGIHILYTHTHIHCIHMYNVYIGQKICMSLSLNIYIYIYIYAYMYIYAYVKQFMLCEHTVNGDLYSLQPETTRDMHDTLIT